MDKLVHDRKPKSASGIVRISAELDERLSRLSEKTGRSKSYYARKALESYLEDLEDYLAAVDSLTKSKQRIPLGDLRKRLGLDG